MSDWEIREPKWLVPELDDEYRAEPFTPEPTPQAPHGSSIMERLDAATMKQLREIANGGAGETY